MNVWEALLKLDTVLISNHLLQCLSIVFFLWLATVIKHLSRLVADFSKTFIPAKSLITTVINSNYSKIHACAHTNCVKKTIRDGVETVFMFVC